MKQDIYNNLTQIKMKTINLSFNSLIGNLVIVGDVNEDDKKRIEQAITDALYRTIRTVEKDIDTISVSEDNVQ